MRNFDQKNLCFDPIHGYVSFSSNVELLPDEISERRIIDHPWVQRMRHIHQLQTAWWVFPSAEHTRFQHVLGAMHLGSRWMANLFDSLQEQHADLPSRAYVESLVRLAGLLHDVGHGPFGHFFDAHFLSQFNLTHETLGAHIIVHELGELIGRVRRNPNGMLAEHERLDARQIAWLIQRPRAGDASDQPRWLVSLRSLLSGIYTIDNMDFVLRDAYMSGYSGHSFDLDRLLYYSFFSERGLTIHDKGIDSLVRFLQVRAELFHAIYFHRTVRSIDLTLADLFRDSRDSLFPGNPLEYLEEYQGLTESSLLVDVARWHKSTDSRKRALADRWQQLLKRQIEWLMICQRSLIFVEGDSEIASIFTDARIVEAKLREQLPTELKDLDFRVDIARHIYRPHTLGPASGQNFMYDSAQHIVRPLNVHALYNRLPVSHRICRVYAKSSEHAPVLARALDALVGSSAEDDPTNM